MKTFLIGAVAGAIGLAGCGGGGSSSGGDSSAATAPTVTITATNQGAVTRAVIDGERAIGQSRPFAANGGSQAQSIGSTRISLPGGVLQSVVQRGLVAAFGSRHSARIATATRQANTDTSTDLCGVSGSTTTTISDTDNSQTLSNGDTLTLTFNQCRDSSDDVIGGGMIIAISSVTSGPGDDLQFNGSLAFVQLSASSGARLANIEGSVGVTAAITSTSFQIALAVGASALTVTSSAAGHSDTILYEPGMQLTVAATDGAVTQWDVTLNGSFTASSIGGRVAVATLVPLRQRSTDAFPSSGQVVVTGAVGTRLRVTALGATSVQLELDGDGEGAYEQSKVVAWDTIR